MNTRDAILLEASKGTPLRSAELVARLGVSRQTVSGHLRRLVDEGVLDKAGSTRNAVYSLADSERIAQLLPEPESSPPLVAASPQRARSRRAWTLVAMGAAAVAVVAVAVMISPGTGGVDARAEEAPALRPAAESATLPESPSSPESRSLPESQVIGAEQSLSVGAVRVEAGSEITLQAGEMVAIGEGFTVDEQGALVVEIESPESVPDDS